MCARGVCVCVCFDRRHKYRMSSHLFTSVNGEYTRDSCQRCTLRAFIPHNRNSICSSHRQYCSLHIVTILSIEPYVLRLCVAVSTAHTRRMQIERSNEMNVDGCVRPSSCTHTKRINKIEKSATIAATAARRREGRIDGECTPESNIRRHGAQSITIKSCTMHKHLRLVECVRVCVSGGCHYLEHTCLWSNVNYV